MLTVDGEVYCFGDNGYGQCGNVTEHVQTLPMRVPLPVAAARVSCGEGHPPHGARGTGHGAWACAE